MARVCAVVEGMEIAIIPYRFISCVNVNLNEVIKIIKCVIRIICENLNLWNLRRGG